MRAPTWLVLALAAPLAGCSDDPADVAGTYSISVTNDANGCEFESWMEDATASNIQVVITQDGSSVSVDVAGVTGAFLDLWLGGSTFTGTVDGDAIDARIIGENALTAGNCAYTFDAVIDGQADGDVLTGRILYEAKTNGNPDCGALTGCQTVQRFNGTRPPTD